MSNKEVSQAVKREDPRLEAHDAWEDAPDVILSDRDIRNAGLQDLFDARRGVKYAGVYDAVWQDGSFDEEHWRYEYDEKVKELKCYDRELVNAIQGKIRYTFTNEYLLLQAFTRRSYAIENELDNCSEELEFFGDRVLEYIMIRCMAKQFTDTDGEIITPFSSKYNEGELTKIKTHYVCKEYLANRAVELGLDQYIYYGNADAETDSAKEDMMEAVIGAIAIDCNWDYSVLEEVVEDLLLIHFDSPTLLLQKDPYERLNSWYQQHFGCIPEYEIIPSENNYRCFLRINGRNRNEGSEHFDAWGETRSKAKSNAAEKAYKFLCKKGRWIDISESGVEPELANAINQVQELYQKKYIEKPEYTFDERDDSWTCTASSGLFTEMFYGKNKTEAKKAAAFFLLLSIFKAGGIEKEEWKQQEKKMVD